MADTAKFGVDISALYLFGWMPAKRAIKGGRTTFALSFAGIIQIRYEGYLSPGNDVPGPLASRQCNTSVMNTRAPRFARRGYTAVLLMKGFE
jgi:hypothetical protein